MHNENARLQNKLAQLEQALNAREQEIMVMESRYRKCIEKAKDVIKCYEPRLITGLFQTIERLHGCVTLFNFISRLTANHGQKYRQRKRITCRFATFTTNHEPIGRATCRFCISQVNLHDLFFFRSSIFRGKIKSVIIYRFPFLVWQSHVRETLLIHVWH